MSDLFGHPAPAATSTAAQRSSATGTGGAGRTYLAYPDARHIPAAHRPQHTACPVCGRHIRTGWRESIRVVGQHHAPADAIRTACCDAQPCEGSFTPVAEADCFDSRQAPAVAAITGSFPAVAAGAITRRQR